MKISIVAALLLGLAACQSPKTVQQVPDPQTVPPAGKVASAADARAAVAAYISQLPNKQLYVPDSARVNDNDATWQVLVPRTDWAGRMPNRARFEVDKQTGQVSDQPVK